MSRKNQQIKEYDAKTALVAANSFRAHSKVFIEGIGTDMDGGQKKAAKDLGGLIASATMLALSVELYLKSLRMLLRETVPATHHLWALYRTLPNNLKSSIQREYERLNPVDDNDIAALEVAIGVGGISDDQLEQWGGKRNKKPLGIDIKSVLNRSSDAFQTWRYLHEGGKPGELMLYRYEFMRLGLIADILCDHATDGVRRGQASQDKGS